MKYVLVKEKGIRLVTIYKGYIFKSSIKNGRQDIILVYPDKTDSIITIMNIDPHETKCIAELIFEGTEIERDEITIVTDNDEVVDQLTGFDINVDYFDIPLSDRDDDINVEYFDIDRDDDIFE